LSTKLPPGVDELLKDRISSFEKLELIVALHDAPRTTLSVDDLSRMLTLPRETVREVAIELRSASLVELTSRGEVQLLPPTTREHAAVVELVRLYREDRFTVVTAMGEIAVNRLRNMTARAFADAFVIRKKRKKDGEDG
jgi:Mn-dependent DtxR family transcriptional regulator